MSITVQQDATMYGLLFFCKLLYTFRVVTPPIIESKYNCNYSIWHWSNHLSSNWSTIAECSRDSLTSVRCCNYSYMCSWWWVQLPPRTCREVYRNIINCIYIYIYIYRTIIDLCTYFTCVFIYCLSIKCYCSFLCRNMLYYSAMIWPKKVRYKYPCKI